MTEPRDFEALALTLMEHVKEAGPEGMTVRDWRRSIDESTRSMQDIDNTLHVLSTLPGIEVSSDGRVFKYVLKTDTSG